jgi:hypothetical protein
MTFYRLNRKKDDTIPENDFFSYKILSTDFRRFWNSSQNRRNDFKRYVESFFETLD